MQNLRRLIRSPAGLFVFEAAGRHLSFTKAAEELNVTQAAVSYAVKQLEAALGVRLFDRAHRKVVLSETGARFHQDVTMGLTHILKSAEAAARRPVDRHVSLSVSTAFAHYWMVPRMAAFRAAHPSIDIRLETTDKDIDLAGEGFALGIRRGAGSWPGYDTARLTGEEILAVASSRYLEARGRPQRIDDLPNHQLIHLEEPVRPRPTWADFFAANGFAYRDEGAGLRLNDYALVIQAAIAGEGIALGWRHIVAGLLDQRLLEQVTDARFGDGQGFYVLWPLDHPLSDQAATLRDWLIAAA